jgi:exonuclease III
MIENRTLSILQYNVNNSRSKVMIPLFESERITNFDILAIQEPWRNLYQPTTNKRLNQHFELHYMNDKNTRVCFFVNKRVALASYTITHRSKDLCSLALKLAEGRTINVHNIYNPCKSSEDKSNLPLLRTALGGKANEEHIVMGDFNLHHPKWGATK